MLVYAHIVTCTVHYPGTGRYIMGHGFFRFSPPDVVRRSNIFTNLHRRESCLTVNNIWVFHPGGGIYPILLCPKHVHLFPFLSKPCDSFGPCPITRVHYSTPYTVMTYSRVPMTPHRTPNPMPIRTVHSHPCHAMFSCTCNAIMPIVYI